MPYVQRANGHIIGIFANRQPGYAEEWVEGEVDIHQPPPATITPLQARRALRAAGLLGAVNAWIAAQSEEVQEAWEYCVEVRRDDALIVGAAAALGLTGEQIDDLFRTASGIIA